VVATSGTGSAARPAFVAGELPRPTLGERAIRAFAGTVLARPWFDRAALLGLKRVFFPTSRLWAAAQEAAGDVSRFYDAVPVSRRAGASWQQRDRLQRVLEKFEARRAAVNAIETEWQGAFFGAGEATDGYRAAVEAARRQLKHDHNSMRGDFRFLLDGTVPRVKLAVATPDETAAVYGPALKDFASFVAPPGVQPSIEVSHSFVSAAGRDLWVRFKSPSARLGDTVYARVQEPVGVSNPPTVIFGHGICVDFDHWQGLIDECAALVALGFRVIRPEAAWHGRRAPIGRYGGEAVIGAFPTGALDALTGAMQEWAVLAQWSRDTSTGPLVFAGSSLGAMTTQLASDRAHDWPVAMQPDAMLLLTHTGDMSAAIIHGALSTLFADRAIAEAKGWTDEGVSKYFRLLNPTRPPVMRPGRIVSVLGSRDVVLPYDSGHRLVETWGVPAGNVFVWDRGHFSVPMTLIRNDAPLRRLKQIVAGI
jgi:pimeloyl-ACP methyl ester carboxylesterase